MPPPLALKPALRCVREIAQALNYAHEKGFIHRDVKPDNILLREDGSCVLGDFGIARAEGDANEYKTEAFELFPILRERADQLVADLERRLEENRKAIQAENQRLVEQIRREVELLQAAGKPVVASMANVAASGGYWISMNADAIVADPSTITGSIGIFGMVLSGPRALEKIGMRADGVGTTPLAGAFDPTRPLVPELGELFQAYIDHGYRQFIGKVAEARDTEVAVIDEVARGRVWSGAQAKERGLVDELGGLRESIAKARELAKLGESAGVTYIETPLSPFEQALADMDRSARMQALITPFAPALGLMGERGAQQLKDDLAFVLDAKGKPFHAVAHCFCAP